MLMNFNFLKSSEKLIEKQKLQSFFLVRKVISQSVDIFTRENEDSCMKCCIYC